MNYKHEIGKIGEKISQKYLINNQYKILENNFRYKYGEIDIIALDNLSKEIVFVEVKTRTNLQYGQPREAVNNKKKKCIINTARKYIYINKFENKNIRFDVIEVYLLNTNKYKLNHLKNVF